jgi:hypothetical protein
MKISNQNFVGLRKLNDLRLTHNQIESVAKFINFTRQSVKHQQHAKQKIALERFVSFIEKTVNM